jgi:hypothetical protein
MITINDPFELLQLLWEVALASLVAEESQLFNQIRPRHIGVLNNVLKTHFYLLLYGFLQFLLDIQLHLIVLLVERRLLGLWDKGLLRVRISGLWEEVLVHA